MKKYIHSLCLMGVIVYSCKTQQTISPNAETNSTIAKLSNEEILKKGENLYSLRCGKCHGLPTPSEFTVDEWKPIMVRMAPKAKLDAEETNWLLAYVNANAKK